METSKKLILVLSATLLVLVLAIGPAAAAEGGGGGEGEGSGKIQLAESQHEFVGLILLGALGIAGLAALVNARKQLRGERDQASGEWRWR